MVGKTMQKALTDEFCLLPEKIKEKGTPIATPAGVRVNNVILPDGNVPDTFFIDLI